MPVQKTLKLLMIFWSNRVLLWNDVKQILLWDCQQFWIQHVPIWEHPLEYSILSISCMPVQKTTDDFWSNRTLSQHAKWTPSCHGYISISLYIIFIYISYLGNQHASISTQWNASKYLIWSHVTPGSRILSVFVFLTLIKAQKITLNNWKAMKNNEK